MGTRVIFHFAGRPKNLHSLLVVEVPELALALDRAVAIENEDFAMIGA